MVDLTIWGADESPSLSTLLPIIFKAFVVAYYGLFILVDGLCYADSLLLQILTLPHLVAGLALTRAAIAAMAAGCWQVLLFFIGLVILGLLM